MTSKSEGRRYAGLENCAPSADRASSGAQNLREVHDFSSSHIWPQKFNLQVFSRISKRMKNLYEFQIQPRTPAYLLWCLDICRCQNCLIYSWIGKYLISRVKTGQRGNLALQTSIMVFLTRVVGNVNLKTYF